MPEVIRACETRQACPVSPPASAASRAVLLTSRLRPSHTSYVNTQSTNPKQSRSDGPLAVYAIVVLLAIGGYAVLTNGTPAYFTMGNIEAVVISAIAVAYFASQLVKRIKRWLSGR